MGDSSEHAKYNPSSLEMFERCPGFQNRNETNPIAERGTKIHKALETDDWSTLDDDKEKPIAQACQDIIDAILEDHKPTMPDNYFREVRVGIDLGGGIETFGTFDRLITYNALGELVDFKTGYLFVADAEVNAQVWAYVIGVFQKHPKLKKIRFTLVIPNRDEVSDHTFNRKDIPEMQTRLNTIIRKAMEADQLFLDHEIKKLLKILSPQPELCIYCNRQTSCPALAKKVMLISAKLRPEIQVPKNIDPTQASPQEIAKMMYMAPLVEEWAKGLRAEALRLNLEEGIEIPGFKRIESTTARGVTSVLSTYNAIKDIKGMDLEAFLRACGSISIPDLEKMVAAAAPRGKKAKASVEMINKLRHEDVLIQGSRYYYLRESKK